LNLYRYAPAVAKKVGKKGSKKKVFGAAPLVVGTLAHLEAASKGGVDPDGEGASQIAGDVLWSDPAPDIEGGVVTHSRGVSDWLHVVMDPILTIAIIISTVF
jgi:hypothetical protein